VGVLTLVSLVGWNLTLSAQVADLRAQSATQAQQIESLLNTTRTINLAAQGPWPDASGRAFVSDGARTVVIMVQLRPLESDQTYQTWLITDAGPQPSDVFTVNAEGLGLITVTVPDQLADFTAIGISVEPAGGSQTPTEVVLVGGL